MKKIKLFFIFIFISNITFAQINTDIYNQAPISNRIGFIRAKFIKQSGVVKISWKRVNDNVKFKYRIYRDTRVLDSSSRLSTRNFVAEVDGVASFYYDRPNKSGRYYYAVTIVNLKNKEVVQLVKDQSFTGYPVAANVIPSPVTGIQINYELGKKNVIITWTPTDMSEVSKFRIYRSKKFITKTNKNFLIAELSRDKREYKDVISIPGRYFYLITTVNAYKIENNKILPGRNYTKSPVNIRFFTVAVETLQGYGYYTELDVNKAHPPIFFRFVSQLFKRKETFIAFDINDVKQFKRIHKKLISLPVLPKKFRVDKTIERLNPTQTKNKDKLRKKAIVEEQEEIQEFNKYELARREKKFKRIFEQDSELIRRENQRKQAYNQKPESLKKQDKYERKVMPIKKNDPELRASREKRYPNPRAKETPAQAEKVKKRTDLKQDFKKLRYIVTDIYYKKRKYKNAMDNLYQLYKKSNFSSIKNRAIYFYGRILFDIEKYSRALRAFLILRGTKFYKKYKSEIDFMIRKSTKR